MNVIGKGGFAGVKRARLKSTGQEFAIKMVCYALFICAIHHQRTHCKKGGMRWTNLLVSCCYHLISSRAGMNIDFI